MSTKWLTVNAGKKESDPTVMVISGPIGQSWWDDSGVSSKEFHDELNKIPKGKAIHVRINSEGGSIKDGLEIYNAIKSRAQDVTAYVDGYAVSIASVIPLAAHKVISPKSSIWMIHEPWSGTQGNAEDHRKSADMLDKHGDLLAQIYADETGKSKKSMRDIMLKETWLTGEEAVEMGLADECSEEDCMAAFTPLDSERFKNIPVNIFNMLKFSSALMGTEVLKPTPVQKEAGTTQDKVMNKKLIVALLKKHGIEAADTESETELQAKLEKIPNAEIKPEAPKEKVIDVSVEIKSLREEIRRDRITERVNGYVEQHKITKDEASIWVEAAMKDEAKSFDILDKKEAAFPGGEPLPYSTGRWTEGNAPGSKGFIPSGADEIVNIQKQFPKEKGKQVRAILDDYENIIHAAIRKDSGKGIKPFDVMNANSISGFTTAFLLSGSLTALQNVWAPFKALAIEYDPDPYKPLATATLKNPTAFGTTGTDLTNFTTNSNSTVGALTATMHQYTQPFQISNTDLNSGLRMEDLIVGNLGTFSNKVIDVLLAPIVAATFTATPLITAPGAFGFSDSATLQGQLQKANRKNIIIDGTLGASLMNTPGFFQPTDTLTNGIGGSMAFNKFGWDILAINSRWTGAGANIKGFACHPQAIIGVHGVPLTPAGIPGGIFNYVDTAIPLINVTVRTYTWFDVNARTMYTSYDIMLGVAAGDATAGVIIATGTPG